MAQNELSDRAGISEISIRKYEANDRKPKHEKLINIARTLRVSIHEINNTASLTFDADVDQSRALMEILHPSNPDIAPTTISAHYIFDETVFNKAIKARILDTSKQYEVNVDELYIADIISQVDNLISFELFKRINK